MSKKNMSTDSDNISSKYNIYLRLGILHGVEQLTCSDPEMTKLGFIEYRFNVLDNKDCRCWTNSAGLHRRVVQRIEEQVSPAIIKVVDKVIAGDITSIDKNGYTCAGRKFEFPASDRGNWNKICPDILDNIAVHKKFLAYRDLKIVSVRKTGIASGKPEYKVIISDADTRSGLLTIKVTEAQADDWIFLVAMVERHTSERALEAAQLIMSGIIESVDSIGSVFYMNMSMLYKNEMTLTTTFYFGGVKQEMVIRYDIKDANYQDVPPPRYYVELMKKVKSLQEKAGTGFAPAPAPASVPTLSVVREPAPASVPTPTTAPKTVPVSTGSRSAVPLSTDPVSDDHITIHSAKSEQEEGIYLVETGPEPEPDLIWMTVMNRDIQPVYGHVFAAKPLIKIVDLNGCWVTAAIRFTRIYDPKQRYFILAQATGSSTCSAYNIRRELLYAE